MLKSSKGFTLIELLIGIVLVSVAFLGLAHMQVSAIHTNTLAHRVTEAATTAQDKIEELRGGSYAQIVPGADNPGIYTRTWNVQAGPESGTKTVTVTVSWQGGQHQVQLQSIIGR